MKHGRFMDKKEDKIPTIDEMKEEALKIASNIPNLKEKSQFITSVRGYVIEFSIIIERCFDQLITSTGGEDLVINPERKTFHLITSLRSTKNLHPSFMTKSRDIEKLIEKAFPKLEDSSKSNFLDRLEKLLAIRAIFAHVPVNWNSDELEFDNSLPYKRFFNLNQKWKSVSNALNEFISLHKWITDVILNYNRQILLKQEIYSRILLGKSHSEILEETKKNIENSKGKKS